MEIATAFVTIRPQTDGFEAELAGALGGQDVEVPLTADTSDVEGAIDEVTGDVEVGVDADTSDAEAAIDGIEDSEATVTVTTEGVEDAQAQVDQLADSTSKLGDAAQGALGGMGGVGGAAGGAAGALGATALAGAGAAAGLFSFAQAAIDAESAEQRFELTTGSLGGELRTIDVGGISGDIGELALKLGSSDEAMLNATSSFVTFAQSTGAADDEIVTASGDINALALRAVALNPALGDAGAVAERMTNALARGGRATTAFGIGLTSAEINARAMADTGKTNTTELTQFEKAAAGAAIAVERLGNSMGEDFTDGAENARTEWNRMTESLGEAQEQIGGSMLPAIENITEAVTELADGIANLDPGSVLAGLWDISGPGLFVNGLTDLHNAVTGTNTDMESQSRVVEGSSTAWADAAEQAATYEEAQSAAASALAATLPTLGGTITEVNRAGDAFGVLNASSNPQVVIDNLQNALFAWDVFQQRISTISQLGPNIAGALQQLGPQIGGPLAGALVAAIQQGNFGVVGELDALITEVAERGGDVSAVMTGFAQNGMEGAIAAVQSSTGPMGAAGTAAGASGAAGIDAGLTYTNAAAIGAITGTQYGAGVSSGISGMYSTINAVATNVIAGAGNIGSAYSRGRALGSAYGSGIVAGLAGQIGNAAATKASLDAVVESAGRDVGRGLGKASAPVTIVHQTVMPNGDVLAESMFEVDRRVAIAEGYEQ